MARVGDKLGRYELLEPLGKGAAGTVFRARDSLLGIDVCVKILHSGLATQAGIVERFKRELLLARRVAHPGVCKIFDIQEADGTHFLTMEYVRGETLSTRLNRDGRMPVKHAVSLMRQVAEALGAAHKAGVVHRDVKPGNIIIGENGRVTIVDFGVATAEDLDRLTRAGVVLGSRSYMAPETWQGKPATAAGDVWALGVILYGCVTGRLPYKGEGVLGVFEAIKTTTPTRPSAINPEVTPALEQLIFKAMSVDLEQRFPDASAVEAALATFELTLGAADVTQQLPLPSAAPGDERLHRPSKQPLPQPLAVELPPVGEASPPPKAPKAEPTGGLTDEMSLYAPGDPSSGSFSSPTDTTRLISQPPELLEQPSLSPERVAEAFDAAFGLDPLSPSATEVNEKPPAPPPVAAPDTVVTPAPLAPDSPPAAQEIVEEATLSPLELSALPDGIEPESRDAEAHEEESEAPPSGEGAYEDKTALVEPLEASLTSPPVAVLEQSVSRGASRRTLIAALAVSGLALVVVALALLLGGDEEAPVLVADTAATSAFGDEASPPLEAPADPPPLETPAPSALESDSALLDGGASAGDAGEEEALAEDPSAKELLTEELAADEGLASDDEADDAENETAAEELAAAESAAEEGSAAAPLAAATAKKPRARSEVRRSQPRANPETAARAKYQRKRQALNAALAKKGVLPGDASAVDGKRREMTQAAQRRDYARALSAADEALRALADVSVDAAFVGKKLSRFNQSYDRITDEGVRAKLAGVIKDVGSDYSKGRYEDANQKLNRAFSLMRQ